MSKIYEKIESKLDRLEELMKLQAHLKSVDLVNDQLNSLGMYRAHMNDEQADFVDGCRFAKDEQIKWKVK